MTMAAAASGYDGAVSGFNFGASTLTLTAWTLRYERRVNEVPVMGDGVTAAAGTGVTHTAVMTHTFGVPRWEAVIEFIATTNMSVAELIMDGADVTVKLGFSGALINDYFTGDGVLHVHEFSDPLDDVATGRATIIGNNTLSFVV
jgi:hypothetical protein